MNTLRFGRSVRALRRRRGLRQLDVAAAAGVSSSTVSRVERGLVGRMPFAKLRAIGAVVDGEVELDIHWRGEALDRLLDEAHSRTVEQVVGIYQAAGWQAAVEASFSIDGERGSIDVFAWHPANLVVAVNEIKSVVPDNQATLYGLDRKRRLAPLVAKQREWHVTASHPS